MAKAERSGAESRDGAAGAERRLVDLRTVKGLQPVAGRIVKRDQRGDAPCVGEGAWLRRHRDARALQPRRQRLEGRVIRHLPAEKARTVAHRAIDHDALLAVIHAEGEQRIAALDRLQSHQVGAELPPVVELVRSEAGISQTPDHWRASLLSGRVATPALAPSL